MPVKTPSAPSLELLDLAFKINSGLLPKPDQILPCKMYWLNSGDATTEPVRNTPDFYEVELLSHNVHSGKITSLYSSGDVDTEGEALKILEAVKEAFPSVDVDYTVWYP